ncbi:ureidoacrylate peracid hydrolase [Georgenia soli]|uniref:Ureidoacrylate peracid hydrolase n=1 Tax=Georgenia soli TaxID=638953 RepID=A0A2A9ELE4_9MICO|nr:cysteine hydrolase [Georgenia soli]PFG39039.1 ureidoacrylate peracid hydrolase [Georgenia soli]
MTLPTLHGRRPAVVTIDMHRGHLDPAVATMPLSADKAERVTQANARLLKAAREHGIPVIHVVTSYRSVEEIASNPWWSAVAGTDATRANVLNHQLPGSPGLELMAEVYDPRYDLVVSTKKRYDCFAATDLDHALRSLRIDTLFLTGVNTNSCVLATTVAANTRDYTAIVVEECVDTMDPALHTAALAVIRQAFGWVGTTDEVVAALDEEMAAL